MKFGGAWMHGHGHVHGAGMKRGAMKFVLLHLLKERPRHGYELIRELEERSAGLYSPSPGTIYPTLQLLEDEGYIRGREEEGKKVYEITPEGESYLEGHKEKAENFFERTASFLGGQGGHQEGVRNARRFKELKDLFRDIGTATFKLHDDPDKLERATEILHQTRRDIENLSR